MCSHRRSQGFETAGPRSPCDIRAPGAVEGMKAALIEVKLDGNARGFQAPRIFNIFVTKQIEVAGEDECRRQPGQVDRPGRCGIAGDIVIARFRTKPAGPAAVLTFRRPDELTTPRPDLGLNTVPVTDP